MNLFTFRSLRIFILLLLLVIAAFYTKGQLLNTTTWIDPLDVIIYPINGDDSGETALYIENLHSVDFREIDTFTEKFAKHHQLYIRKPTRTKLGDEIHELPPTPPHFDDSIVSKMMWSLQLRYWAWKNTPDDISNYHRARLFVIYQQGKEDESLPHSLGLQKGLLGIVHAFADKKQAPQNKIVITHELMHTVGASDKYQSNGMPMFPEGYAKPTKQPRYPQHKAEIMAGVIAVDASHAKMAKSLEDVVVGDKTAREIGWIE